MLKMLILTSQGQMWHLQIASLVQTTILQLTDYQNRWRLILYGLIIRLIVAALSGTQWYLSGFKEISNK